MYVRQAVVPSLESIGKPLVIQSQAMQYRGVQVVDMNGIADNVVAIVVRGTVADAGPHSAPCEPHGEAASMMVPAVIVGGERSLGIDRTAELAAKNHERILQESALFQIGDQGGAGAVDIAALTP